MSANDLSSEEYSIDEAFKTYSSQIQNEKDKLAVIIDLIMLKSGFKCGQNDLNQTKGSQFNKLVYNQARTDFKSKEFNYYQLKSNLIIILLQSGTQIDLTGKYGNFTTGFLKINLREFFYEPQFYVTKKLNLNLVTKEFEIKFKDTILNPIKFYLKTTELISETSFINGLCDLPVELIVKLALNYLDVHSIVKLTKLNKYFYNLINSNSSSDGSIWFKLIRRDFDPTIDLLDVNYRIHYVKLYHSRKLFNKKFN